jgi:DNA-binding transcriptional LysR family regulator
MSRLLEIEAFVAVAEQGSFVAAAELLQVSSSYTSKLVTRLEERLGVRLIQRTTRRHTLTPQGERYLVDCQEAFEVLRHSEACLDDELGAVRGALRVTAPTGLGLGVLVGSLNRFALLHPQVELSVSYLDRKVDLVGERFDLAIRVGQLPDSSLRARRIGSYERGVVGSPELVASLGSLDHPKGLEHAPAVVYAGHSRPGEWILRRGEESVSVQVRGRMQANNGKAVALAAADGLGLSYLPSFHTAELEAAGRLVQVLPGWGERVPVHVVFPTQRQLPLRTRSLIEHIVADLSP